MMEGEILEVELCEEIGEEVGSGDVGGVDIRITSYIDGDTVVLLQS